MYAIRITCMEHETAQTVELKPRTVRLSDETWDRVQDCARKERRKASDWLRLQIEALVADPVKRPRRREAA